MNVFGSAYHTPDFLLLHLVKKHNVPEGQIAFVSPATRLPKRGPFKYFIFLNALALRRNLARLSRMKDAVSIVCASPMDLNDFENITPLDYAESDSPHIEAFVLDKIKLRKLSGVGKPVVYKPNDYAMVVQNKVESFTGILTPFMTFIYTMPSATHQKPIKELACSWLVDGDSLDVLAAKLAKLTRGVHMTQKQQDRFMTLLTSDSASAYQAALQEAKHFSIDSPEFRVVADKHAVSAYEMRYMLSVVKALA